MYYTYVLKPKRLNTILVGSTDSLERSALASQRGGWNFMYFEACGGIIDALQRERFFRSAQGIRYIDNLVREKLPDAIVPIAL